MAPDFEASLRWEERNSIFSHMQAGFPYYGADQELAVPLHQLPIQNYNFDLALRRIFKLSMETCPCNHSQLSLVIIWLINNVVTSYSVPVIVRTTKSQVN